MADTVNYYDLMRDKDFSQYASYMNDSYINMAGPKLKIFKLDKIKTEIDDFYGQEKNSRIYLPYFEVPAMFLTNPFATVLDSSPYEETEQNIKIIVNFDRMVSILRELKVRKNSIIYVETLNGFGALPSIEKANGTIKLYYNNTVVLEIDLSSKTTTKKIVDDINTTSQFSAHYTGSNDETKRFKDFVKTSFPGCIFSFFTEDSTYENITEVIEMGDIVISDKYRAYEVVQATPTGDIGWNYATYSLEGKLVEVDILDGLPGDFRKEIEKRQHGNIKVTKE